MRKELGLEITLSPEDRHWLKVCDRLELLLWCMDQFNLGNRHVWPMIELLEAAFNENMAALPEPVREFLCRHCKSGTEYDDQPKYYFTPLWRRTSDTGFWQGQVNDNLLPEKKS